MGEWPHKGLKWQSMDRSFAWSLRQVVDAALILPDDHPLVGHFTVGVNKCLDEIRRGWRLAVIALSEDCAFIDVILAFARSWRRMQH